MTEQTEQKLKKIGIPTSYVSITAVIVYIACNSMGACM